jgi:hypothetical protein
MGSQGADVMLSAAAKELVPYEIECKNQEIFKTLYKFYSQAESHGDLESLLVISMNHKKPLAILDLDHCLELIKRSEHGRVQPKDSP